MSEEPVFVEVPYSELSESTLNALIEAFVLREGTDYGHSDYPLEKKVQQVRKQLERKEIKIFYNLEEQSFDIIKS